MDWLENDLKQALARKEPSPDFESRVALATRRRNVVTLTRRWMAAAAGIVIAFAGGSEGYHYYRGQMAKEQVLVAMRIAGGKLQRVQQVVGARQ